jgi:RNA polymerase sigma-70 factor (ECF subfamily)
LTKFAGLAALLEKVMASTPFRVIRGTAANQPTDAAIAEALRRGDRQAELEAWNRFSPGATETLRRLLGPGPDREDLLQEVFLRFFKRIGTLREPAAVRGFLAGICIRVVRGEIAGRQRRRWLHLTPTGEAPDAAVPGPDIEARDTIARYYALLEELSASERSIFVARTIEKLTLAEVAETHGVSISTAQRRLARASKRIAALVRRDPELMLLAGGQGNGEES